MHCVEPVITLTNSSVVLTEFDIQWTPLPVFLLEVDGPDMLSAGNCATYDVNWSLSFVDEEEIVIYVPLPDGTDTSLV
jgi:hypothetical protein